MKFMVGSIIKSLHTKYEFRLFTSNSYLILEFDSFRRHYTIQNILTSRKFSGISEYYLEANNFKVVEGSGQGEVKEIEWI